MDLHELAVHGCAGRRFASPPYAVRPPDAAAAPWDGETSWEQELNRHRLLTAALLRSFGGRVVASHQSALVLHDARLFGVDLGVAHLVRVADSHSRHRRDAVIHPALPYPAVIAPCGLPTVDPAVAADSERLSNLVMTLCHDVAPWGVGSTGPTAYPASSQRTGSCIRGP